MRTLDATQTEKAPVRAQGFVSLQNRRRIVARIAREYGVTDVVAASYFDEATSFLGASVDGGTRVPSKEADKGWHVFLWYTKAYTAFCRSLGRTFIHHEPNDRTGLAESDSCDANDCTAEDCYQDDDD